MALHRVRRGLDLPLAGAPRQSIEDGPPITRVALVGDDFHGLKPRVRVEVGQDVRRGDLLCEDAAVPGVRHTAPGAGEVVAVHRGPGRALQSIVIELSDDERGGRPADEELVRFARGGVDPRRAGPAGVRSLLLASGAWTAFRTRPFSRVPAPGSAPHAIFVAAIDTNPLAADPDVVLAERLEEFSLGLRAIATLTQGRTYLCVRAGSPLGSLVDAPVTVEEFAGPHPAGTAGLHVHVLEPVGRRRTVWTVGYQDVASMGSLLRTGTLDVRRTIAMAGPPVPRPRLLSTRLGARVADFATELAPPSISSPPPPEQTHTGADAPSGPASAGPVRWISGSVLSGKAVDGEVFGYMGRYDVQLTVLREGGEREFLAWLAPGARKFSALPAFASRLRRTRPFDLSTDTHGSRRTIIPLGQYERVTPMDILPTFLLRALAAGDAERAEELGCLELDEEDLALCSFVDPGKTEFGPLLRRALDELQRAE